MLNHYYTIVELEFSGYLLIDCMLLIYILTTDGAHALGGITCVLWQTTVIPITHSKYVLHIFWASKLCNYTNFRLNSELHQYVSEFQVNQMTIIKFMY